MCSFGCVHSDQDHWSRITQIMVYQRNRWIHSGHGFISSFDELWSEWSWVTDPDSDHPKGTCTTTAKVWNFYFKFISVSQIQFRESFVSDKQSKGLLEYRVLRRENIKSFFNRRCPRRRRRGYLNSLLTMFASFWTKFTYLCLRQVYGVFSLHLFPAFDHFGVLSL